MKFRTGILSLATGLAAVALSILPAAAANPEVAVFSGSANAAVLLSGGGGTFSFSTGAPLGCTAVDPDDGVVASCTINASGSFTNIVCGTGSASGTATISDPSDGGVTVTFSITFVAGVGVLTGSAQGGPVAGAVLITANSPQTDGVHCTNGFTVNSANAIPLAS